MRKLPAVRLNSPINVLIKALFCDLSVQSFSPKIQCGLRSPAADLYFAMSLYWLVPILCVFML